VTLLLERGADINAQDWRKRTPLHLAADHGHASVVKLLLERDADITAKDAVGWTALHLAAHDGRVSSVTLLLERGADVNGVGRDNCTPLQLVVGAVQAVVDAGDDDYDDERHMRNCVECAQLLFRCGATITAEMNGAALMTLATLAVAHRRRDLVFTLLWRGVHVAAPVGVAAHASVTAVADEVAVMTMLAEWAACAPGASNHMPCSLLLSAQMCRLCVFRRLGRWTRATLLQRTRQAARVLATATALRVCRRATRCA
jgi:hypothetical protein